MSSVNRMSDRSMLSRLTPPGRMSRLERSAWLMLLLGSGAARAQLSSSAYRVLGQSDFRQNGANMVQGVELNGPSAIALDSRNGQLHIYIADSRNARFLGWSDAAFYQTGD